MKIKNIKGIVKGWKCGVYTPEQALKMLLEELDMKTETQTKLTKI